MEILSCAHGGKRRSLCHYGLQIWHFYWSFSSHVAAVKGINWLLVCHLCQASSETDSKPALLKSVNAVRCAANSKQYEAETLTLSELA